MRRFAIFAAFFPPLAMLVFIFPDVVSKGLPSSDQLVGWLVASYPIAIIPALLLAWADRAFSTKPFRIVKTMAAGGAAVLVPLFIASGSVEFWPIMMVFLVGALPAALCSWLSSICQRHSSINKSSDLRA